MVAGGSYAIRTSQSVPRTWGTKETADSRAASTDSAGRGATGARQTSDKEPPPFSDEAGRTPPPIGDPPRKK